MKYQRKLIRYSPCLALLVCLSYWLYFIISKLLFHAVPITYVALNEKLDYEKRPIELLASYLIPPSGLKPKLNDTGDVKTDFSQFGLSLAVDDLLLERRDGFFVECGSASGELWSNSLYFELTRNWTGLLAEVNPVFFRELFGKQRNAFLFTTCIGPTRTPRSHSFKMAGRRGGLSVYFTDDGHSIKTLNTLKGSAVEDVKVMCFPLSDVLRAIEVTRVHYLSLDVGGAELDILKTIDFIRIVIDVVSVNYANDVSALARYKTFFGGLDIYEKAMIMPRGASEVSGQAVIFKRKKA